MYKPGGTIAEALGRIQSKSYVLPAIQREFELATAPSPPDVADALAIAMCHFYLRDSLNNVQVVDTAVP